MTKTDEFLVPGSTFERLLREYKQYGSLTIGFDFDGTVHDYHKTGASYEQVIKLLRDLKKIGCKLVCWTAFHNLDYVNNFLYEKKIPFDSINEGGIPLPWESKKPFFSALLDDRAGLESVYKDLTKLVETINENTRSNATE
jgi:hypothetical protein